MKVSENKPHSVHLRLTDEQYEFLKADADFMGVGVSDYLRMIVNMTMSTAKKMKDNIQLKMQLGDLADENEKNDIEHFL